MRSCILIKPSLSANRPGLYRSSLRVPFECRRRLIDAISSSILSYPNPRAAEAWNDWTTRISPPQQH